MWWISLILILKSIASVNQILQEIDSLDKPTIMVFKIDAYAPEVIEEDDLVTERKHYTLEEWEDTWMAKMNGMPCLFLP